MFEDKEKSKKEKEALEQEKEKLKKSDDAKSFKISSLES
jgi:hypothetical protein